MKYLIVCIAFLSSRSRELIIHRHPYTTTVYIKAHRTFQLVKLACKIHSLNFNSATYVAQHCLNVKGFYTANCWFHVSFKLCNDVKPVCNHTATCQKKTYVFSSTKTELELFFIQTQVPNLNSSIDLFSVLMYPPQREREREFEHAHFSSNSMIWKGFWFQ